MKIIYETTSHTSILLLIVGKKNIQHQSKYEETTEGMGKYDETH